MKTKIFSAILFLCALTGCTDWERTTFQSLSASKTLIDTAQADYESRTIPHTLAVKTSIEQAKAVQSAAVEGLLTYEKIKTAKGTQTALQAQQAIVVASITELAPLIASIKSAYSSFSTQPNAPPAPVPMPVPTTP
jgi:hypothetical protein